jgi:hypothetical protein
LSGLLILSDERPIEKCAVCRGTAAEVAIDWNYIPVPSFGNLADSRVKVATIGLNPATNEPRLPKLTDYRKQLRERLTIRDIAGCVARREKYFNNHAKAWHSYFVSLDSFLGRVNHLWSYASNAVHIDLVGCPTNVGFGGIGKDSRGALIANCRLHFLRTLMQLPEGTLLFLDGRTVYEEGLSVGLVNFESGPEEPKVAGLRGLVTIDGRQFKFRGWNMPVGKLTPLQRIDLVIWLRRHCL